MKVLHIAESSQGGVGTYLSEVIPAQTARFGADHVRALIPARHAAHLANVNRRQIRTWHRSNRSVTMLFTLARKVRSEVAAFRPDVVHAHSSFAGLIIRLMYGWRRVPFTIVYCPHGWAFDRRGSSLKNRITAIVECWLAPLTDRIVLISEHERRLALEAGIPEHLLTMVVNGIGDTPTAVPARWADDRTKVLFVGRLDRQKGYDTLLDAVEPFGDQLVVRVIGKPVADGSGVRPAAKHVTLLGWRSMAEVSAEIAAADLIVVPSRWEGFGLVALEAMRGSRAVVASDVGGLREIVVDGETGKLTPSDSPVALARALTACKRGDWARMGRAGRERFLDRFTAERMNDELASLYSEITPACTPSPERSDA